MDYEHAPEDTFCNFTDQIATPGRFCTPDTPCYYTKIHILKLNIISQTAKMIEDKEACSPG